MPLGCSKGMFFNIRELLHFLHIAHWAQNSYSEVVESSDELAEDQVHERKSNTGAYGSHA